MKTEKRRAGQAGVTLIEMLVVVVIIGLFVALVETYQQADGSLVVPAALRTYLKTERIQA